MVSIIKFQAISGATDESPPCYLLEVDDFRFLLDCGLQENFRQEYLEELRSHVDGIDAVLLSHPDLSHLGALPYLVGKCGLRCPIYGTIPIHKMGQMFMYDYYQSRWSEEEFKAFNLDDVDAAFDRMVQVRYNQPILIKQKNCGISVVASYAGSMVGGAIWKIQKAGEEDIVYAPQFNIKRDGHLNGCDLTKLGRPFLLITSYYFTPLEPRKIRDTKLITAIVENISKGNVLIVSDTAGRVLELIFILANLWKTKNYKYPLCVLSNVSYHVIRFAKSQIEWMNDSLIKSFELMRNDPFRCKHLRAFHTIADVNKIIKNKVVLVSMPNLETGFARELFVAWSSSSDNAILLTYKGEEGTLCRDLIENGSERTIDLLIKKRVKLDVREQIEYSSSSDDDVQIVGDFGAPVIKPEHKKHPKRFFPSFPFIEKKCKVDDYGEPINVTDYKIAPTRTVVKKKEVVKPIKETPSKCVTYETSIEVKAKVDFLNFEGRSDVPSTECMILQMKPKKVILIGGPTKQLMSLAKRIGSKIEVFCPQKNEIINATVETHMYQIRLPDALYSSLKFQENKGVKLAWVDAIIQKNPRTSSKMGDDSLILQPIEKSKAPPRRAHFVNEVKLSDLKALISSKGFDCEISEGVLYCCMNTIAIKKSQTGIVEIEGNLSKEYYIIRQLINSQFTIL